MLEGGDSDCGPDSHNQGVCGLCVQWVVQVQLTGAEVESGSRRHAPEAAPQQHIHSQHSLTPAPPVVIPCCAVLCAPRRVIMLVQAGAPVDSTIDKLLEFMEPGDIIIDGGNEW